MTVVDNRRDQQPKQQDEAARANRDRAREHGNRTMRIADIAEAQLAESERERGDRTRYEDGFQVLSWLVSAPWSERVLEIDRVLHDEHGSLDAGNVAEFIDLVLSGRSSLEARHAMLRRPAVLADEVRRAAAEAREVAAYQHQFADAPESRLQAREAQPAGRPALPSGTVPPQRSNGAQLPHREPIAPSLPPMYPAAPPEAPAQQTGQIAMRAVEAMQRAGHEMPVSEAALAGLNGKAAPSFGPPADPAFSATALPQAVPVRSGDTQRMTPVRPDADEVLAELAMGDASVGERKVPGVRPFVAAAGNGGASRPAASEDGSAGDGDA